jgi:hypothetical protein
VEVEGDYNSAIDFGIAFPLCSGHSDGAGGLADSVVYYKKAIEPKSKQFDQMTSICERYTAPHVYIQYPVTSFAK